MEQRLQLFLQMEQLSQSQFADKMGIQRSGVTHLLSGRNKPSFDFIARLLQTYPTLNAEWLILGKGKPYKDSSTNPDIPSAPQPVTAAPESDLFDPYTQPPVLEETEMISFNDLQQIDEIEEIKSPSPIPDTPKTIKAILILYEDGTYEKR